MKCLTACDALSEHLVRVTADMHPSPDRRAVDRETVYAVEEEGLGNSGARKFLGLVDSRQANAFPNRIFADLLRPWQSACVSADTPLEAAQEKLLEGMFYSLPVMDDASTFIGAVTRDSVLRVVLDRERELSQAVRQGLDLQEQQHSLVAFEIHDGLIQYVTAARMQFDAAARHLDPGRPEAAAQFASGMALLQEAVDEARALIRGLRPPILEGVGLKAAIESLVKQQQRMNQQEIEFVADAVFPHLSRFQETTIFRIVQETLGNAVRHSGSRRIRVELSHQRDQICVAVRDWGRGFDAHAIFPGYGLKGLRHRAQALYGEAVITSSPGGTHVSVRIPSSLAQTEVG